MVKDIVREDVCWKGVWRLYLKRRFEGIGSLGRRLGMMDRTKPVGETRIQEYNSSRTSRGMVKKWRL